MKKQPDKATIEGYASPATILYVIAVTQNGNTRYLKSFKPKGTFLMGYDTRFTDYIVSASKGNKSTMTTIKKLLNL